MLKESYCSICEVNLKHLFYDGLGAWHYASECHIYMDEYTYWLPLLSAKNSYCSADRPIIYHFCLLTPNTFKKGWFNSDWLSQNSVCMCINETLKIPLILCRSFKVDELSVRRKNNVFASYSFLNMFS